jgi:hypothetical protein
MRTGEEKRRRKLTRNCTNASVRKDTKSQSTRDLYPCHPCVSPTELVQVQRYEFDRADVRALYHLESDEDARARVEGPHERNGVGDESSPIGKSRQRNSKREEREQGEEKEQRREDP